MKVLRCIEKINKWAGYVGALLVIPLTFTVVYEITMRNVFNKPTEWVYDVSWMLYGIMFLLGGAYTLQVDRHVRVDILYQILPPKVQKGIDLFFFIGIFLPMVGAIAWKGYGYTLLAWNTGELLSTTIFIFPAWVSKIFIPIGFTLLFLQGVVHTVRRLVGNKEEVK